MSQRECAGFNWPELSIPASDPVSISPEAVKRTGPLRLDCWVSELPVIAGVIVPPRSESVALGEVQALNFTACSSVAACFLPSAVAPVASIFSVETDRPPPLGVHGLGHAASATVLRLLSEFPASL
jgi:hypothetical protein